MQQGDGEEWLPRAAAVWRGREAPRDGGGRGCLTLLPHVLRRGGRRPGGEAAHGGGGEGARRRSSLAAGERARGVGEMIE